VGALWMQSYFIRDQFRLRFLQINTDAGVNGWTVCEGYVDAPLDFAESEWTAGTDPNYFPIAALPDPSRLQRFKSLERIEWDVTSTRDYPLLTVQKGWWVTVEGLRRNEPDPPDRGAFVSPYVSYAVPLWPAAAVMARGGARSVATTQIRWATCRKCKSRWRS
jgi:hypothetical protein